MGGPTNSITLNVTLPRQALAGSVVLSFADLTVSSATTTYSLGSEFIGTLAAASGTYTCVLNSSVLQSVGLVDHRQYNITLSYQDSLGNAVANSSVVVTYGIVFCCGAAVSV